MLSLSHNVTQSKAWYQRNNLHINNMEKSRNFSVQPFGIFSFVQWLFFFSFRFAAHFNLIGVWFCRFHFSFFSCFAFCECVRACVPILSFGTCFCFAFSLEKNEILLFYYWFMWRLHRPDRYYSSIRLVYLSKSQINTFLLDWP